MKAWFVFKDGEVVGNPLGYKSEKTAKNYIRNCDDLCGQWFEYSQIKYGQYNGAENIPEELKESGIFSLYFCPSTGRPEWIVSYTAWQKDIWKPYVKEHYKIEEKEYKIVFED